MTDYSQLSDFEINQEITCILNPEAAKMTLIGNGSCFYDFGPDGSAFYEIPILDYCNNPADAWPIIVENGISVGICGHGSWGAGTVNKIWIDDENPLRAAMIVYLMMREADDTAKSDPNSH